MCWRPEPVHCRLSLLCSLCPYHFTYEPSTCDMLHALAHVPACCRCQNEIRYASICSPDLSAIMLALLLVVTCLHTMFGPSLLDSLAMSALLEISFACHMFAKAPIRRASSGLSSDEPLHISDLQICCSVETLKC